MIEVTTKPVYLPNPFYAALTTAHAPFARVNGLARRFEPEVIPFAAVPEPSVEAMRELLPLLTPDEEIYLAVDGGETIASIRGITVVSTLLGLQMRFCAAPFEGGEEPGVVALGKGDVEEILDLKRRAFPGFFGPRAAELGSFFGVRDAESGRLIAMGGERLATPRDREVSAVCTDPEYLGRGHAARVVRAVVRHQAGMGSGSFLHVTASNKRATSLYERIGFCITGSIDFVKLKRV